MRLETGVDSGLSGLPRRVLREELSLEAMEATLWVLFNSHFFPNHSFQWVQTRCPKSSYIVDLG